MIRCNLSILLAEQNLKITKVSNDTGISRTTLTSLSNNYSQGIQFETLNTLCLYLKITPDQLISFIPIDINIIDIFCEDSNIRIKLQINDRGKIYNLNLYGTMEFEYNEYKEIITIDTYIELLDDDSNEDLENENNLIIKLFQQLPRAFIKDLEHIIFSKLEAFLSNSEDYKIVSMSEGISYLFDWPSEFWTK